MERPKILCVKGPTASGKTALAVALALDMGGEVVSADSMQIYKGMDIGTAKPDMEERKGVPHHMLDVAEPGEEYSAARYAEEAAACVDGILRRGRVPIVAGGTGLYIRALVGGGVSFAMRSADGGFRDALARQAEQPGGMERLFMKLASVDPKSAAKLHPNDKKRIFRALEVFELTGRPVSELNEESRRIPPRYDAVSVGLTTEPREILYRRIEKRVDEMFEKGLLPEVRALWEAGKLTGTAAQAIGYKELVNVFEGRTSLDLAGAEIKKRTRQYAKRQLTWFRGEEGTCWIPFNEITNLAQVKEISREFAKRRGVL